MTVTRDIAATRPRVWDVLANGWTYSGWVVGNSRIRAVDPNWPAPGSLLRREAGGATREILDLENKAFIALVSALQIAQSKDELARTRHPHSALHRHLAGGDRRRDRGRTQRPR